MHSQLGECRAPRRGPDSRDLYLSSYESWKAVNFGGGGGQTFCIPTAVHQSHDDLVAHPADHA